MFIPTVKFCAFSLQGFFGVARIGMFELFHFFFNVFINQI